MTAQHTSAATGTGPDARLYWKLPIRPSTAPNRNSAAYTPTVSSHPGSRLPVVPVATFMAAGYCANRSVSRSAGPPGRAGPASRV